MVSDGEDLSTTELILKVAKAYGVNPLLLPVPASWIQAVAGGFGKGAVVGRLLDSLVVNDSMAREKLGWTPVISMDQQLQKMALYDSSV